MIKTKAHFESFILNGGRPKNGTSTPVVVRAPQHLRCFRATITINNFGANGLDQGCWIATTPTNEEAQCVYISNTILTITQVAPATDTTNSASNHLILDRRGVGYMDDEFYLYSDEAYITIVWEGEVYE
jgi:hypothetical protein